MPRNSTAQGPGPLTLLKGSEQALADIELRKLKQLLAKTAPQAEWGTISAGVDRYEKGDLFVLTAPSLFATEKALVIEHLEKPSPHFVADLEQYLEAPAGGVWLIGRHAGGNGGQRVLQVARKKGHPLVACEPLKSQGDKQAVLEREVRAAGASITREAATALVESLGSDLGEMLAAAHQLSLDSGGTITDEVVHTFHRGRIETSVFDVADALADRDGGRAVLLARQAFSTGVGPVNLVGVLAAKFRLLAAAKAPGVRARDMGVADWMLRKAARQATHWSDDALGTALLSLADADEGVKGASRSPEGVVELAMIEIARASRAPR